MATTSYIYHALGVRGYKHLRTEFVGGELHHHVRCRRGKRRCRHCRARGHELRLAGRFERRFHAVPVGGRRQLIVLEGHRQRCRRCGRCAREPVAFAEGRRRYTRGFAAFVVSLCAIAPVEAVARWLGVGWDRVKAIHKEALKRCVRRRRIGQVRRIAVDEFAIRKGHRYMTVVLDLDRGAVLHLAEGKDAGALSGFLRQLRRRRAPLEAVALDLSAAYRKAVREVFGTRVAIVHDPYHVVALVNAAIDETRRAIVRRCHGEQRQAIKGLRFVLLRGLERVDEHGRAKLRALEQLNAPLYEAYLLKEYLRRFWRIPNAATARRYLQAWITLAAASSSPPMQRLAETLQRHREGLLTYFRHRITSGPLEGLNNRIKTLKRQAYGFRDMEYFQLRVLTLHEPINHISG